GGTVGDGVKLENSGVALTPIVENAGAGAQEVPGGLFYPNADTDLDVLTTPTPIGVELFTELRSPASPEHQSYRLSLPDGAVARETADPSGVEILQGGNRIAFLGAPVAWDAQGTVVPTSYQLDGDVLTVSSSHRGG